MKSRTKKNGVKKIRLKLCMSQGKFADAVGVSAAAISNYELATRMPKQDVVFAIIDFAKSQGLNASLEDIYLRS